MVMPLITPVAMSVLAAHSFPGNIRELKNVMERALILSGGNPVCAEHLQLFKPGGTMPAAAVTKSIETLPLNIEEAEQELIQRALLETGGNVAEAARLLGVNRSRIYRRFPQSKT